MSRLIIVFAFFLSINSYAQTNSYLKDETAPGSLEDIVKLLNLKNAKRISIFSQEKDTSIFLGEILLNQDGKCFKKHSCQGNITYHIYNDDENLIEKVFFHHDSTGFKHHENKYNKNGDLIERIYKDKSGTIIERDRDTLMLSITIPPVIPRYRVNWQKNNSGDIKKKYSKKYYLKYEIEKDKVSSEITRYKYNKEGKLKKVVFVSKYLGHEHSLMKSFFPSRKITKYTYNSAGYLTRYFSKGFYLPSSKSCKEEEFKRNKIEYRYEYNNSPC